MDLLSMLGLTSTDKDRFIVACTNCFDDFDDNVKEELIRYFFHYLFRYTRSLDINEENIDEVMEKKGIKSKYKKKILKALKENKTIYESWISYDEDTPELFVQDLYDGLFKTLEDFSKSEFIVIELNQ